MQEESMSNQPVQEIRRGRIRASIWVDETERGPKYSTIFTKLYKAGDRWQDTAHFGVNDLPLIVQVAELARAWILQQNPG